MSNSKFEKWLEISLYAGTSVPIKEIEDALNISWDNDVADFDVKWMVVYITLHNGQELSYEIAYDSDDEIVDYKRPKSVSVEEYAVHTTTTDTNDKGDDSNG